MIDWLTQVLAMKRERRRLTLQDGMLPGRGRALALAPHPDDPDAVAVTLRMLHRGGWELYWTVLTSGWSGVQDAFVGPDREAKRSAREAEQRESAAIFGLPEGRLTFLCLQENDKGEMAQTPENRSRLFVYLNDTAPALVILPHENDTNATHRLTYRWFADWASQGDRSVIALANEDPKTIDFQPDLEVIFDSTSAAWKNSILECHRSQSVRNMAVRGITFGERILNVNRAGSRFAERFQVTAWEEF